ncbi:microtubule binding motor protein [Lithospermum erythrorhizon]|uniref:Microtubule binding motor protein n=1 Tax=Lithospermum erythrorhizon TaxID=34254 RepID=A0AAV3NUL3_LITER
MPLGSNILSSILSSANKSNNNNMMPMRGLKGLIYNNNHEDNEEIIVNDYGLAQRKAEEAAARRYQAAQWLREMDQTALDLLPLEPTEEDLCMALRNGLILCNVLNKINPRAILKVVENPVMDVQFTEGPAQSAIQYFENMRNFLMAVGNMKLLTFEASDLEKGGSSAKVVDCILCLKGYYEWKQAGGIGVWRYGGTVKITALPKESPSSSSFAGSESADESLDDFDSSSQYEQLVEYFQMSSKISLEKSEVANILAFLFDHFGLGLVQAYLTEGNEFEGLPFNSMVIDSIMRKVVKDFSSVLESHGNRLGLFLKRMLNDDCIPLSKHDFLKAILAYLAQRATLVSSDFSKFCICGGKYKNFKQSHNCPAVSSDVLDIYQKELEELRAALRETKFTVQQFHFGWEEEQKRLVQHIQGLEGAASSYHKVMEENRMLYNQIQDLKGTIRVYCRVKPFLSGQSEEQSTVDYIGENGDIMIVNRHKQSKEVRKIFSFNKVFGTNVTQEQIYGDTQPLIRSVLDGFNVCIFAYGQTGSGKTYTMSGPDLTTEETWGVNYRALNDLFNISKERMDFIEYDEGVQMIEIYNEQVRDLLTLITCTLDIRNNSQLNGLNVPDASLIPVRCTKDVLELMKIGQRNRAVGATALNERSSRSHSILTVHVRGRELASGSTSKGCLHLVDLAGSERVLKSEAVGERLKEAQHINKSLSALGDVISALAQKSSHIPYRNSKLTQVLQDSLGGQAKTLMFVHINPEANAIGETLSTLKFAERVASVNLGAARSNKETGEIRDLKDEISTMKSAMEKKELELEQLRSGIHTRGAVSPPRGPRYNSSPSVKPDNSQRPYDDSRISEARSCSSGKQRKSRFPSKFTDKDTTPGMPFLAEERSALSFKGRSPSPPIRRSVSTERGSLFKGKSKTDAPDNLPAAKIPFLNRVPSSKTTTAVHPTIPPIDGSWQGYQTPFEPVKRESISDILHGLQRVTLRRVPEHEEEQFKQALNVRQGGIRKAKPENKVKIKNHISTKLQKVDEDVASVLMNDTYRAVNKDKAQNADLPDPENELVGIGSPVSFNIKAKRLHRNSSRDSQNMEPRDMQTEEFLLDRKQENKIPSKDFQNAKGTNNSSMALLRRSQSTPRGRFII